MIRALIFDFDGLILETEGPVLKAWQEVYRDYGQELPLEQWLTTIGTSGNGFDPVIDLEQKVGRALDWGKIHPARQLREHELVEVQPILPGVVDILAAARRRGLKLGVASSSSQQWVSGHLKRLGLNGQFDCIRVKDDVACAKPEPDLYLAVLAALALRGDEAIAFEDSTNGLLAARRAGIYCVAVPNWLTATMDFAGADLILHSLADLSLEQLLQKVGSNGMRPLTLFNHGDAQ